MFRVFLVDYEDDDDIDDSGNEEEEEILNLDEDDKSGINDGM